MLPDKRLDEDCLALGRLMGAIALCFSADLHNTKTRQCVASSSHMLASLRLKVNKADSAMPLT